MASDSNLVSTPEWLQKELDAASGERGSALQTGIDRAISFVWGADQTADSGSVGMSYPTVSHHAAEFLKTAALFMPGRYGIAATIALNSADTIKANDSLSNQTLDGMLGALKGATMRGSFALSDKIGLTGPVGKGIFLGFSNRFADTTFDHRNFVDLISCDRSSTAGQKIFGNVFDTKAAGADALIFGVSHLATSKLLTPALRNSALAQNMITGATFGASSGAYAEIQMQGANFDPLKIAGHAGGRALLDGIAAIPGGLMLQRRANAGLFERNSRTNSTVPLSEGVVGEKALRPGVVAEQSNPLVRTASESVLPGAPIAGKVPAQPLESAVPLTQRPVGGGGAGDVRTTPVQPIGLTGSMEAGHPSGGREAVAPPSVETPTKRLASATELWTTFSVTEKVTVLNDLSGLPRRVRETVVADSLHSAEPALRLSALKAAKPLVGETTFNEALKQGLKDQNQAVRIAAAEAIDQAPLARRAGLWRDALQSTDQFVRMVAVSKIGSLPLKERVDAWRHVLNSGVLSPRSEVHQPALSREASAEYDSARKRMAHTTDPTAADFLVRAIETLPGDRLKIWQQAFNDNRTHASAIGQIDVVDSGSRGAAWRMAWNSSNRVDGTAGNVQQLVKQVQHLPSDARTTAWNMVAERVVDVPAPVLASGLEAFEPGARLNQWRKLITQGQRTSGIVEAISAIPEAERGVAWNEALGVVGFTRSEALARAIPLLPATERFDAFKKLLENHPTPALVEVVAQSCQKNAGAAIDHILVHAEPAMRDTLLKGLSIDHLVEANPGDAHLLVSAIVSRSAALAEGAPAALRKWWGDLGALSSIDAAAPAIARRDISSRLSPERTAQVLLGSSFTESARLAAEHPEIVRLLAEKMEQADSAAETTRVAGLITEWLQSVDLNKTLDAALKENSGQTFMVENSAVKDVLHALCLQGKGTGLTQVLSRISDMAVTEPVGSTKQVLSLQLGIKLLQSNAELAKPFAVAVESALVDQSRSFSDWTLPTARLLANLQRAEGIGGSLVRLPDLRMPAIPLSEPRQSALRGNAENALFDRGKLVGLLGQGELGRLFPAIFGATADGGIVGRPQHAFHDFDVATHTLNAMDNARRHPEFAKLSAKDQTNLLWAMLLHDAGKTAGTVDLNHDWASARMTWGVLNTLGYSASRIQRIVDLVGDHQLLSYDPHSPVSQRLNDPAVLDDLAVRFRNPAAIQQVRIMNESDIRAVKANDALWTSAVEQELNAVSARVGKRSRELSQLSIPVLTNALPHRFGLYNLPAQGVVLAHASQHIGGTGAFFKQIPMVQSPEFSASASPITPERIRLFDPSADFVAVVSGPTEKISQANSASLHSGYSTDWSGHVRLTTSWSTQADALALAQKVDGQLQQLGLGKRGRPLSALAEARRRFSQYDSVEELWQKEGSTSALARAQSIITDALLPPSGRDNYAEVKINEPTVQGIGIVSRGRTIVFEGTTPSETALPQAAPLGNRAGVLIVPKAMWQDAQARNIPFVILDR